MEIVAVVVLLAVVAGVVTWGMKQLGPPRSAQRPKEPWSEADVAGERIVLDIEVDDPQHPSVQRLVFAAARQALDASPDLDEVEVVDRTGTLLGRVHRDTPLPRELEVPAALLEPHARRSRTPSAVPHEGEQAPTMEHRDTPVGVPPRLWSDRFDLTPQMRAAVQDGERPADVIRAILEVAGLEPERQGDLVRVGETAIVVVPDVRDGVHEAINHAYLRYKDSGASHGILVRLSYVSPDTIRRHDAATPDVRHVSAEAIQRMADAVAVGADPLAFAVGPAVLSR